MLRTATRRPGFTLVELMVAAAVCVLIMAVLATAFQLGIDTMRQMRSTGELMDQLRGATTALKTDLKAPHLLDKDYQPIPLSKYRWDTCQVAGNPGNFSIQMLGPDGKVGGWVAPVAGFVRIGSGPMTFEGTDPDGLASYRATNHYLHFTSILSGQSEEEYYYASTPTLPGVPPTYSSTAAEIAYFLEPVGVTAPGGPTTNRLIRRQRLVALNDTQRRDRRWPTVPPAPQPDTRSAVFSLRPPTFFLNTLQELTNPNNRLGLSIATVPSAAPNDDALAPMASRPGEDTLLSNVISFEVQAIYAYSSDPRLPLGGTPNRAFAPGADVPNTATVQGTTSSAPFDVLPTCPASGNPAVAGMNVYDSWSNDFLTWTNLNQATGTIDPAQSGNVPPLLIRVQALQIRIRIWDPKLQNARQVTFIQDL